MTTASNHLTRDSHVPVRLAVLCSSAGGVLDALCTIAREGAWPLQIATVITDRECYAERIAAKHNLSCTRIDSAHHNWSVRAADRLTQIGCDAVLLLIMRKVGPAIWRDISVPVINLHPSLLPSYTGLQALERNFADAMIAERQGKTISLGVTAHIATDQLDAGPIISQRSFAIREVSTLEKAAHLCFLLKLDLVLECVSRLQRTHTPSPPSSNGSRFWSNDDSCWISAAPALDVLIRFAQPWAAKWLVEHIHASRCFRASCTRNVLVK